MLRRSQFKTLRGYGDDILLHSVPENDSERAFAVTRHPCLDEDAFDLVSVCILAGEDRYSHECETVWIDTNTNKEDGEPNPVGALSNREAAEAAEARKKANPTLYDKPVCLNGNGSTKSGYPIWVDQMLIDLHENVPGISLRQLARAVGVSTSKAHKVIEGNGIHEGY
jgi:hypothetical protein